MKKIGIMTFWFSDDNYGQILQSFALQKYLRNEGYDAFVIKYYPFRKPKKWFVLFKIIRIYPVIKYLIKHFMQKDSYNKMSQLNAKRQFNSFRMQNINFSEHEYYGAKEIKSNPPIADIYIAGSDQIWHYNYLNEDGVPYFLEFGSNSTLRLSYAPSFRFVHIPKDREPLLNRVLAKLDGISVREKSGIDVCKEVGQNAVVVVDPTLLLEKKDYSSFLVPVPYKDYIYCYILNIETQEDIKWSQIKEYSLFENLHLVVTVSSGYHQMQEWFDNVEYSYSSIPEWLSLIEKSRVFVTTSFHGVVFALLLHSNFIFVPLTNVSGSNDRLVSLLEPLGLLNRIWDKNRDLKSIIYEKIDWEKVDKKIETYRQSSREWLKFNLSKCK